MFNLIDIIASVSNHNTLPSQPQKICIAIDVSGSTAAHFLNGMKVLEKEIEIAEKYILDNSHHSFTVVAFDDKVNTYEIHVLKEEMMTNIHSFNMVPGGSTYTDIALNQINKMKIKPSKVILLTDGQTNSTKHLLTREIQDFAKFNISLEVIAVSDSNLNMMTLTQNEEQGIPGMDLINHLGNSISKLVIYNKQHSDVPYIGASTSVMGKNCLTFMEVPISGFIPDFIRSVLTEIVGKEINWGQNQMEFKKFLSEIGKLFSALFVSFPERNMFVEDTIFKLTEFNVQGMTSDRIRNIIIYGFDCSHNKKPILYTNFEAHVKESSVKKAEFADAITQLKKYGTPLNSDKSISMPSSGMIVINENVIPLVLYLGPYPTSGDKYKNYYFGCDVNSQALRIGMREFCGHIGFKNSISSHSVIFYMLNQISLLYIKGHSFDEDYMKLYKEIAIHQTSLETLVEKGKYSGVGCYTQWKNGLLPKMHFSEEKTHTSVYSDPFVNPLRLIEPVWWALMMSMLGLFNEQLMVYEEALKGLHIEPTEKEFLNWIRIKFCDIIHGNPQVVRANTVPTSIFTLSEFEPEDDVYFLKDHGTCKTKTHYSKEEIEDYITQPNKGCVWCHYQPTMNDFERVTFESPNILLDKAKTDAKPLTVDVHKLRSQNFPSNMSARDMNSNKMIRINMIGVTGAGKSTFSKRISELISEKGGVCLIINADKWSKIGKKGKELTQSIKQEMKEFDKKASKLKVVVIDICNEKGPQQNCFEIDFSDYETYDFMPNMIKDKFHMYEYWCLNNVLERPNFTKDTLYWLNPVSAGVNTCIKVHKTKALELRKYLNITAPYVNFRENWSIEVALNEIKPNAEKYQTLLDLTSMDKDIIDFMNENNIF